MIDKSLSRKLLVLAIVGMSGCSFFGDKKPDFGPTLAALPAAEIPFTVEPKLK